MRKVICSIIVGFVVFVASAARGTDYTFTTINYPNASWTDVEGINDSGDITGFYSGDSGILSSIGLCGR